MGSRNLLFYFFSITFVLLFFTHRLNAEDIGNTAHLSCERNGFLTNLSQLGKSCDEALDRAVENYSKSDLVKKMLIYARKQSKTKSGGECYRYVKSILIYSKLLNKSLEGRYIHCREPADKKQSAITVGLDCSKDRSAMDQLKENGFINLLDLDSWKSKIKSAYDTPKGALLVYDWGPGHMEFNAGEPGRSEFISDYHNPRARTGPEENGMSGPPGKAKGGPRRLIGVFIKPGVS